MQDEEDLLGSVARERVSSRRPVRSWLCPRVADAPGHRADPRIPLPAPQTTRYRSGTPAEGPVGVAGPGDRDRETWQVSPTFTGGLSVHPDNHTVLESRIILSVEPMFGNRHGFYDLED
jgi:hypothetical protein